MKINSKYLIVGFIVGFLALIVFVFSPKTGINNSNLVNDEIRITDKAGNTIIFSRNGLVKFPDGHTELWTPDKVNAFLEYLKTNSGNFDGYLIDDGVGKSGITNSDELLGQVFQTGGEPVGQYFATATPGVGGGGGGGETGGGGGSGGGGGGGSATPGPTFPPSAPSWCKHWLLSYCGDAFVGGGNSPTATPTSSYPPGVIEARDCTEWNQKSQYKTIIGDGSCVSQNQ